MKRKEEGKTRAIRDEVGGGTERSVHDAIPARPRCEGRHKAIPARREVRFNVVLHCTPENTRRERALVVAEMPGNIGDLKQLIQTQLHIPACCQSLYFESVPLRDNESLHFYRIQDNDTLHVHFNSEADVGDILDIISSLQDMITFLESIQPELSRDDIHPPGLDLRIIRAIKSTQVESLAFKYFYPSATERADANRKLFIANGGLQLMHEAHLLLLRQPLGRIPLELQYLEHAILRILWNITASFSVREQVLQRPTLEAISQSMLRVKVERDAVVSAPRNPRMQRGATVAAELDRVVSEVIYKAVGTICNLAEIPKCRVVIASNPALLRQLVAVMLTPTYKYIASLVTIAGLLCLAYSPETHPFLVSSEVLDAVMDACEMERPLCRATPEETRQDRLLLRYFATMFFAQLVSCSLEHLPHTSRGRISVFMEDFLQTADYKEVRKHEVVNGYIWSTLVPFIKLVYLPHRPAGDTGVGDGTTLRKLQELCIEAGVFSLQNMLSGEEARGVLVEEGLVEYVTCMPWNIPEGLVARGRARDLVAQQCQKLQLQPPRLSSLSRAKLAVMHFGLVRMLQLVSVQGLLAEVWSHPPGE